MRKKITPDTPVEDLVSLFPEAVGFLTRRGVRCLRCGEPLWCTLGELLRQDRVAEPAVLITELNEFLSGAKKT
jgi:hypothetical protein